MTVLDNMVCAVGKHAKEHLLNKQFLLFLKALRRPFSLLLLERSKICNFMAWKEHCTLTRVFSLKNKYSPLTGYPELFTLPYGSQVQMQMQPCTTMNGHLSLRKKNAFFFQTGVCNRRTVIAGSLSRGATGKMWRQTSSFHPRIVFHTLQLRLFRQMARSNAAVLSLAKFPSELSFA